MWAKFMIITNFKQKQYKTKMRPNKTTAKSAQRTQQIVADKYKVG